MKCMLRNQAARYTYLAFFIRLNPVKGRKQREVKASVPYDRKVFGECDR